MQFKSNSKGIRKFAREMERKQSRFNRDVQQVVKESGSKLQRSMVKQAVFVRGYATGTTKRSIILEITNSGLKAIVMPGTYYSPYLEYGTRFMAAQPFVRPAFMSERIMFIESLEKLVR